MKRGEITIDDVPKRWKAAVQKLLDADKEEESYTSITSFIV